MRKQNSNFKTAFISEAGNEIKNNDYFAYVELDQYACYVIADGLNEVPDAQSARLAIESVILAFQAKPSLKKGAISSYLKTANHALVQIDSVNKLKASIMIIVTDYEKIRYAYAGNARMRLYRDGYVKEESSDMSLGRNVTASNEYPKDALAKHEERNNLYTWIGQEQGFRPYISKKLKLVNGDIIALYTRGIWENLDEGELDDIFSEAKDDPQESVNNVEDMLLSKQPGKLDNYSFAAIFIDKIFIDPNRKKRRKKIILITVITVVVILVITLVVWLLHRMRLRRIEDMNRYYTNTIEYIQDNNYVRAKEECAEALKMAEKLRDKKKTAEISDYLKLIEAIIKADETYSEEKYEAAQEDYQTAQDRSYYADHIADDYISSKLRGIADYLSVYDYIQLGDTLMEKAAFTRAEEKYLQAKSLATKIYFDEGRKEAIEALDKLYEELAKEEEEAKEQIQEKVTAETGAAELISEGDKAFSEGDYEGAKVYYAMALDKYRKLEDEENAELIELKLKSCVKKSNEKEEKKTLAEEYMEAAKNLEEEGLYMDAKKQYLFAKDIYKEIKEDEKVSQMDNRIDMLDIDIDADKEKKQAEKEALEEDTVSGNSSGG